MLDIPSDPSVATLPDPRTWRLDHRSLIDAVAMKWERHVLPNGLVVLLQPDRSTSLVHVSVGYRVGSMEEGRGQTGLSHFLEHMMFSGTTSLPGSYVTRMLGAGAISVNAMTEPDQTRYVQTIPADMLDYVLFAEADRMANFAQSLDPIILERERRVILEEKRENEAKPLGKIFEWLADGMLPSGHPYRHPVIGDVPDIENVTVQSLGDWHRAYYGPSNAVVVVAGAIDCAAALAMVRHHFEGIAPMMPALRRLARFDPMPRESVLRVTDRIDQPGRFYQAWSSPSIVTSSRDHVALVLAGELLGKGRSSLLHQCCATGAASVASSIDVSVVKGRAAGMFVVSAELRQAPEPGFGRVIDSVISEFIASPVAPERLEGIRIGMLSDRLRDMEYFERRAGMLLEGELLHGDANWFREEARLIAEIGEDEIRDAAKKWLGRDRFILMVDRARPSITSDRVAPAIPRIERATSLAINAPAFQEVRLRCGARLRLSRRVDDPRFHLRALGRGGTAYEPEGLEGIAQVLASDMAIGAGADDAAALADRAAGAGLKVGSRAMLDRTSIDINGLAPALPSAFALLADLLSAPRFGSTDQTNVVDTLATNARGRMGTPAARAYAVANACLFGTDHRLAGVMPAAMDIDARLTIADLERFHGFTWRPDETLLLLAADIDLDACAALADAALEPWVARSVPTPPARLSLSPMRPGVRIIDAPGRESARLSLYWRAPVPLDEEELLHFTCLAHALAGDFGARAGLRLREELGWTYGVQSQAGNLLPLAGPAYGFLHTEVKPALAGGALRELRSIIAGMRGDRPVQASEIEAFRRSERQRLARLNEKAVDTVNAMHVAHDNNYHGPADWRLYGNRLEALTPEMLADRATALLPDPDDLLCLITGGEDVIAESLAAADLGALIAAEAQR